MENKNLEYRIRDYFRDVGEEGEAPGALWERLSPMLGEQDGPRRLPRLWPFGGLSRRVKLGLVSAGAVALVMVLLAVFWPGGGGPLTLEQAFGHAYEVLAEAKTVRYVVEAEHRGFACKMTPGVFIKEEERSLYGLNPDATLANVVECSFNPWRSTTEGTYDAERRAYHTKTIKQESSSPYSRPPRQGDWADVEYILVDGEIYKRLDGGPWQLQSNRYPWESWVDSAGGLPSPVLEALNATGNTSTATLNSLAQSFDDYEQLPDTEIDGVAVSHFRANTIISIWLGEVPQTVDVWIDKDSGLPVKILLESRQPFSRGNTEETLAFFK
ncbi:MAG: hypothetical protein L0177_15895, partial [Chloroflexi bacterium]|nr:hypothetical protein [Chloroflexota bacterium]